MYNENMETDKSTGVMLWLTAYITLGSLAVGTLVARQPGEPFWPVLGIFVLLGIEMAFQPHSGSIRKTLTYLTVITLTASSLYFFSVSPGLYLVFFFVISSQAMMMLPRLWGVAWIALLAVISTISFISQEGWQSALLLMLIYTGGYLFFGIFGKALQDATIANRRSQQLYEELQATHAQLQESIQRMEELAVTKERNRLAREMHDSIGHRLTVSAVQLEGAQRLSGADPEKTAEIIATVRQQVREALAELRQTVTALRQPIELDLPIEQALHRLVESFESITSLDIQLSIGELPPLPDQHRHILYRTVQEGLTNIQRHAEATFAWIYLSAKDHEISLIVSDNGKGFPPDPLDSGYGLRGIQERAAMAGGRCHFEARKGGGAQITLQLPLEKERQHA